MGATRRLILLGEDEAHITFLCTVCAGIGVALRDVHAIGLPAGGDAKRYVDNQFAITSAEVTRKLRRQEKAALLVMRDLDNQMSPPFRSAEPSIVTLFPKWSIDTWIECLLENRSCSESMSVRPVGGTEVAKSRLAAKCLANLLNEAETPDYLPSRLIEALLALRNFREFWRDDA